MPRPTRQLKRPSRTVAIVGLGYVGLPLACLASEKGWRVFGVAKDQKKIDQINAGRSPVREPGLDRWLKRVSITATTDFSVIRKASVVVICVPTPVDEQYNPDLGPVIDASQQIGRHLRRGQLVILESTVNPGVCEEVVRPILEHGRRRAGRDFFLAHCPERIDPGNRRWTVRNIARVVGATDPVGLRRAAAFYQSIIEAPIRPMSSIREAEAVKILENSFRDVNIAFVNEIAQSFARLDIDTLEVIAGASTKPFAFLAHYPSAGVGGHCIPVDPYYLIERAKKSGFNHQFLKLAREINNNMPAYTVDLLVRALNERRRAISDVRVGVLGISYKANVADTRESPTYHVLKLLKDEYRASYEVFDPHVLGESSVTSLEELLS
ncbi:MAG: nucleotide sugar dehydrogenase, partial [Candidatus Kerfeldbacteria bacterium]|nr:nucleotide sugar dehydrogenase [Candidatus Kerfeldbacteria bacterium]